MGKALQQKYLIQNMKFSFLILSLGLIFITSCKKAETPNPDFYVPQNKSITVEGKNGITLTASDVYSRKSSFKRQIDLNDPISKRSFQTIYQTFISDTDIDVYEKIKSDPNSINGTFTIEVDGQIVFFRKIVNGVSQKPNFEEFDISQRATIPCNLTTIHDCVAWTIDDMNWIEYGACLLTAPGCYATLWASCTWEVCHNHVPH